MALVVESYSTATDNNANSLTVTKPTGTVSGDLLLLLANGESTGNPPTCTGFTETVSDSQSGAKGMNASALYKIAGGSEPASYTVNVGTGLCGGATMLRISGWTSDAPVFSSDTFTGTHDTGSITINSGSVASDLPSNSLVVAFIGHAGNNAVTVSNYTLTTGGSNPTWTEMQDTDYAISSGTTRQSIATAYANYNSTNDITQFSADLASTTSGDAETYVAMALVIVEPVGATGNHALHAVSPTFFGASGSAGSTGTHSLFEPTITLFATSATGQANSWTNTNRPALTQSELNTCLMDGDNRVMMSGDNKIYREESSRQWSNQTR